MIEPRALLIYLMIAIAVWLGGEVVHGVKKVGHVVKAGIVKIVHPHRHSPPPDEP